MKIHRNPTSIQSPCAGPEKDVLPERIQTCYQTAIMGVSMSKQHEIPGDESQEVAHPPSRFLMPGSTFNAPVTMINTGLADVSYTNYGQHASGGGRIDNDYGGT
jgi:hypothetical protein